MLKNAYFLAKIGAETAENERHFAENLPKIANYPTGPHDAAENVPSGVSIQPRKCPAECLKSLLLHTQ